MKKISLFIFIFFPLVLLSLIWFGGDKAVSENENRTLKTKANMNFDIAGGGFQDWLEGYLSDQFPLRDKIKQAEVELSLDIGVKDIGGTYVGQDNRLFQKITAADVDDSACVRYAKRINRLAADTEIPTYVMYVPSAGIALRNMLPKGAPMYDYDRLHSELSGTLNSVQMIDLKPALSGNPGNYYATDHHWTAEGAFRAYEKWCEVHGEGIPDAPELVTVSDTFQGTLYSKAPSHRAAFDSIKAVRLDVEPSVTADGAQIHFYEASALFAKDKYNYFQGGNHGIMTITNEQNAGNDEKTLLILKDSFANSFVPYLIGDYHKIIMIDERYAFADIRQLAEENAVDETAVIREIISTP